MIERTFYLSQPRALEELCDITDTSPDEIESVVGRFKDDHDRWPGELKGEVVIYVSGKVRIRHHFKKTKLEEFDGNV